MQKAKNLQKVRDLWMTCHTPPLKSVKKQGNVITQPQSHPIPKFYVFKWDGLGNSISPCFFAVLRGGA